MSRWLSPLSARQVGVRWRGWRRGPNLSVSFGRDSKTDATRHDGPGDVQIRVSFLA